MTSPAEICPYTDRAPYPGAQHVRICQISEITGCTNWNSPADYSRCPIALAHKKYMEVEQKSEGDDSQSNKR